MRRVQQEGDRGILHRGRGRPSNRRMAERVRQKALELYQQYFGDFRPSPSKREGMRQNGTG